jgi:hypothetical protein
MLDISFVLIVVAMGWVMLWHRFTVKITIVVWGGLGLIWGLGVLNLADSNQQWKAWVFFIQAVILWLFYLYLKPKYVHRNMHDKMIAPQVWLTALYIVLSGIFQISNYPSNI